ncbi:hypothetical protein JCM11251_003172 [Rhodosporidiobolus azoricus]
MSSETDAAPSTSSSQPDDSAATPSSSTSSPSSPPGTLPPLPLPTPPDLDAILRAATYSGSALPHGDRPHGRPVLKSPRPSMERYDERCWTRTKQTNARRALGREPQVSMICYINFRNALSDLVPVPGMVNSFLARDVSPGSPDEVAKTKAIGKGKGKAVAGGEEEWAGPHWPWLDGRYIYVAKGREAVARHMKEMGGVAVDETPEAQKVKGPRILRKSGEEQKVSAWETIARIEERCEKSEAQKLLPGKREERIMKRAMGLDEDESERLISLSTTYTSTISRLHAHILRIYTPGLIQLARLPSTFTDGTQTQMLDTVYTRLTDGSAFKFAGRLYESFWNVQEQLGERRKKRREEQEQERRGNGGLGGSGGGFGGAGGGFGGIQPPVASPRDPSRPVGQVEGGEAGGGEAGSLSPQPPGKESWVPGPGGKFYPPGTKVISCTMM